MNAKGIVYSSIAALLLPVPFFLIGVTGGHTSMTAIAGVWWGLCLLVLFVAASPIGVAFDLVTGQGKRAGERYLRMAQSILIAALWVSLLASLVPANTDATVLILVLLIAFLLAVAGAWLFQKNTIVLISSIIFVVLVLYMIFPNTFGRMGERFSRWDARPKQVNVGLDAVEGGRLAFFDEGEPVLWYYQRPDGMIEWYDRPGLHPVYNDALSPATTPVVRTYVRYLRGDIDSLAIPAPTTTP